MCVPIVCLKISIAEHREVCRPYVRYRGCSCDLTWLLQVRIFTLDRLIFKIRLRNPRGLEVLEVILFTFQDRFVL